MPLVNQTQYNEYMREYMAKRYATRRSIAVEHLGSRCKVCGEKDELEIDHVDPNDKKLDFSRMVNVGLPKFYEELAKCQLLCKEHHARKTVVEDLGRAFAAGTHGTLSAVRYCKPLCDACRKCKNAYSAENKRKNRRKVADAFEVSKTRGNDPRLPP